MAARYDPTEAAIAEALVEARRSGQALDSYPGAMPNDLAAAYRIQDIAIDIAAGQIGGWKVGRINPPVDGIDRLSGPIFSHHIVYANPQPTMPIFSGGFGAAEAEFLLRVGISPNPQKTRFSTEDVYSLIDGIHIGIEIASSPFGGINDNGAAVTVSDFGNNYGLVIGDAILSDDLNSPVELIVNDKRVGIGSAKTMLDGPFGAARFLFENLAARGLTIQPGHWISTGAVTGVHQVADGDRVEARFGEHRSVTCLISAR